MVCSHAYLLPIIQTNFVVVHYASTGYHVCLVDWRWCPVLVYCGLRALVHLVDPATRLYYPIHFVLCVLQHRSHPLQVFCVVFDFFFLFCIVSFRILNGGEPWTVHESRLLDYLVVLEERLLWDVQR